MKPYEFYQRRIYKQYKLDPKEVRKWSFYNGRDSEYGVELGELNNSNTKEPTYKETFNTQRNSLTNLIRRLEKNNPEFYDLYRFISAQSKEIYNKYHNTNPEDKNAKALRDLKTSIKSVNDIIKDIESRKGHTKELKDMLKEINKITDEDSKEKAIKTFDQKDESYIREFLKNQTVNKGKVRKWIKEIKNEYKKLIKAIDLIYKEIHRMTEYGAGAVTTINWNEWKRNKDKLEEKVAEMKTWDLTGKKGEELIEMYKKIFNYGNLTECNELIHSVSNYISGKTGEYIAYYFIKKAIATGDKIGRKYLGIINTGSMEIAGTKHQVQFDNILVTTKNANVKIKYRINGGVTITKSLLELCNDLDNFNKSKNFGTYQVVIENWDDLMQNNVFDGYTIQTKFRNDPDSITNNPEYTIDQLIEQGLASTDLMRKYARQLDLFVTWYKRSQEYHEKQGHGKRSWVYASYTPGDGDGTPLTDTNSTDLYERYFNYLLSREEVIEKVYGASVFMFITTNGVTSLQSYLSQKLTRDINPQSGKRYSLLSAGGIVDISKSDRKIRISINSNLHSYADRKNNNPNNE